MATMGEGGVQVRTVRHRQWMLAAGLMVFMVGLAACDTFGVMGDGTPTTETRNVGAFTRIDVSGGIAVTVHTGPAAPLSISAQPNIMPLIATDVVGDTLRIHGTKPFTATKTVEVTVTTPTLAGMTMSGGSRATIDGLAADAFAVDISGGSNLTAAGSSGSLTLNGSGGSRADLGDLTAKTATVDVSGGTNATIRATDSASGQVTGGSHLTVRGDAKLDIATSGGGSVSHE